MEVKNQNPAWLDESHPNFKRWQCARELSIERGKFVHSIVNKKVKTKNLAVLDLGSGEGGTAKVFSENNFVVSFDLSLARLKRQQSTVISKESSAEKSLHQIEKRFLPEFIPPFAGVEKTFNRNSKIFPKVNGSALFLPFISQCFDVIIIQDIIEHLKDLFNFRNELTRILKTNGIIFLSTPNRNSIIIFFADPHWGLPIVSLLKRDSIKKYFLKYFRKDDLTRDDLAQLLSLNDLRKLFEQDFDISLQTKFSVLELLKGNKGIVWSYFHLKLIALCKYVKLDWLLNKIANNKFGLVNKFFTPTFYIIAKRKM